MPPRNLYTIIVVGLISVICHEKAERFRNGALVGDAIALIDRFYVDEVDERQLLEGAMSGLTSRLDPYTHFIPPSAYDSFQDSIQQEFAGIGILIDQPVADEPVIVVTPLVGSPALEAGFLPSDQIVGIDGEDTSAMSMKDVRERLRGPVGTEVSVTVRRAIDSGEGDPGFTSDNAEATETSPKPTQDVDLLVRRDNIQLESVTGGYRSEQDDWVYSLKEAPEVAYVRLTSFGEKTTQELKEVLGSLDDSKRGLILDLRGNGGGLLISAVDICDMFIDSGRIVSTRGRGVLNPATNDPDAITESAYEATPGTLVDPDLPVTVLIDGDSASASEIVAACLKDHGRAVLVGERSFGKGSVQNVFNMESGRSALKMTTARYYRPNGQNIHRGRDDSLEDAWGVRPTDGFEVAVDDETRARSIRRWEVATYPSMASFLSDSADIDGPISEVDPQLGRALESILEAGEDETPAESSNSASADHVTA